MHKASKELDGLRNRKSSISVYFSRLKDMNEEAVVGRFLAVCVTVIAISTSIAMLPKLGTPIERIISFFGKLSGD